jgi:exosortase E/protease (VPEID-CTERM system)
MSEGISRAGSAAPGAVRRAGVLLGLAVVEIGLVSIGHPLRDLWGDPRWWTRLAGTAHVLPAILLAAGVAIVLFGGARLRQEFTAAACGPHQWGLPLIAHLLALGAAVWTWDPAVRAPTFDLNVLAFTTAALTAAAAWALALLPVRGWVRVVVPTWDVWVVALGVAAVAVAVSRGTAGLWGDLSSPTLAVVRAVLGVFTDEVVCDPPARVVGTPAFIIRIGPECAGYEGLGLVTAFVGAFVWLRRAELQFPQALALVPVGLAAAWVANVGRIALLIGIGAGGWPAVAFGGFHSLAGWIVFNAVAVGVVALGRVWPFRAGPRRAAGRLVNPAAAYLVPFAVFLGAGLLTGAAVPDGFDRFYPVRVVLGLAALWEFRRSYARLGWSWSWSWLAAGAGVLVFAVWAGTAAVTGSLDRPSDLSGGLRALSPYWAAVWVAGRIVGGVVVAPLAEELAFRGYLLRRLRAADFEQVPPGHTSWVAIGLSSVAFGLLHGELWPAGTAAGVVYALAYGRRGRLADAVLAHAVTNALVAAAALLGFWGFW